ncbi:aminopeptidase [Streptomyces alfalfae]|uniref:Aminopeptidase n=1 Tax=Streptomyces alfalfae TaxID=1642299 RepID=A0A1P8TKT0_9ACTN|nr:S28 family serine protease [Streptomyces alfalfae]AYA18649.1 aminopeptidase [Streptomyces fradiae]APY88251.1 aminopeptidase [Streptomyces alfalfae]QQC89386.1 aminopeptidase [Streptomyces alfalfae]QUI31837.1 aminopeptidase [Streptomyces alfalfae]RXX46471.1 aminopeptidase [Streptomyces alfalfae]
MRKALRWLVSLVVLIGTVGAAGATSGAATAADRTTTGERPTTAEPDIKDRLLAIPGMSLIEEKPYPGYRFFVLNYTQPVDHRRPSKGTFKQRLTVLHKDTGRPTVYYTSGYSVSTNPSRREPTQIVDGNQISMEYRFFSPSRPDPADWSKLDIWQAATDQHRVYRALKPIYGKKWLATGISKGGMTATYYERFYPRDMAGVVSYVAPNDVVDKEDSAYDAFLANVGTEECRERIQAVQREALERREPLSKKLAALAAAENRTFRTVGSLDKAFEAVVLDLTWGFWQYQPAATACGEIPDAATVSDQDLFDYVDAVGGWSSYTDQGLEPYTPYYYQAGTELGSPTISQPWLGDLSRYGYQPPRNFVPRDIPMTFRPGAMRDVDRWVRHHAHRMMYVYGEYDPYGAERFRPARGAKHDSYVFTAPGANHGATVAQLVPAQKAKATQRIKAWAGVSTATSKPLAEYDARLDRGDVKKEMTLRP